jgi:predicted transposase YbfD/YdcC
MEAPTAPPVSLQDVFARLPEVRQAQGRRHPLGAILNLTVVAMLAGMKSLEAIAQFGRDHGPSLAQALGFTHWPTPCKATLSNVFRRLDITAYEAALSAWLQQRCPDWGDTLALDGKTVRGSATYEVPGLHLLSAYAPRVTAVLAQIRVAAKTNEHKAALEFLGLLPLRGKIVTGDAMFCQRDFCAEVIAQGGDYVLTVKENQPTLLQHIAAMFAEAAAFSPLPTAALGRRAGRGSHLQQRSRAAGKAGLARDARPGKIPGLAGGRASLSTASRAAVARPSGTRNRLRDHQPRPPGS